MNMDQSGVVIRDPAGIPHDIEAGGQGFQRLLTFPDIIQPAPGLHASLHLLQKPFRKSIRHDEQVVAGLPVSRMPIRTMGGQLAFLCADQNGKVRERIGSAYGKRRDHSPLTDLKNAGIPYRDSSPLPVISNLDTDQCRERAILPLRLREPGKLLRLREFPPVGSDPRDSGIQLGHIGSGIHLMRDKRCRDSLCPDTGEKALARPIRDTDTQRTIRSDGLTDHEGIFALIRPRCPLRQPPGKPYNRELGLYHRLPGRVPISRARTIRVGSAFSTNAFAESEIVSPLFQATVRMNGVSWLACSKSIFE